MEMSSFYPVLVHMCKCQIPYNVLWWWTSFIHSACLSAKVITHQILSHWTSVMPRYIIVRQSVIRCLAPSFFFTSTWVASYCAIWRIPKHGWRLTITKMTMISQNMHAVMTDIRYPCWLIVNFLIMVPLSVLPPYLNFPSMKFSTRAFYPLDPY